LLPTCALNQEAIVRRDAILDRPFANFKQPALHDRQRFAETRFT
jgi:hypothetical protein